MKGYFMSKRQIDQVWVMQLLIKGDISQQEAAEICNLSTRQIRRKMKRYMKEGAQGLIHRSQGKTSNRKMKPSLVQQILGYIKTLYYDFGPTFAAEKLLEVHNIKIDHETLRRIMIKHGLHTERKKKAIQRQWREPKHHKGEFVQLDGSYHIWFGNQYSTLIVFIDDATREVFCRFAEESTEGVTQTFKLYLQKYGRPLKLYTDKGKVFKVNMAKDLRGRETQFMRMLKELNIEISYAYSPQAKGRVERVNRTLQDRLVKECRLMNVTTIEQANAMLDAFLEQFNQRFSVVPKNNEHFFRSIENYDLNSILCYKYQRTVNNDYTINYKNRWLQLDKKQPIILYPKEKIDIYLAFDNTITLWKKGQKLSHKAIEKPVKQKIEKELKMDKRTISKRPHEKHPWRTWQGQLEDNSNESKKGRF